MKNVAKVLGEVVNLLINDATKEDVKTMLTSPSMVLTVKEIEDKILAINLSDGETIVEAANQAISVEEINLLAIYSILNVTFQPELEDYEDTLYGQRSIVDGNHAGSFYELSKAEIKLSILKANYQFAEIARGEYEEEIEGGKAKIKIPYLPKVVFKTTDLDGFYGMFPIDNLPEDAAIYGHNLKYRAEDTWKAKSEVCVVADSIGAEPYQATNETHVVSIVHNKSRERFMVTCFPGALVDPSKIEWEELKHGDLLTIKKAKEMGFTHVKLVDRIPTLDDVAHNLTKS